ncbi:MAG: hypothetical protein CNLJKLNK_00470 [Holosporales bacterium]
MNVQKDFKMKYLSVFTILASLVLQNHATGAQGAPMGGNMGYNMGYNMGAFGLNFQRFSRPRLPSSSAALLAVQSAQEKVRITGAELAEYVRRYEDAESLDWRFLSDFSVSGVLDLSGLTKVTKIDYKFLSNQVELTKVILPPHVTHIGGSFLWGCTALRKIDLSPLKGITELPFHFLLDCTGLTEIDLSPLAHLKIIKGGFLRGCTGLTAIDLSFFAQITKIGSEFLRGCTGLTAIDLSPLAGVKSVDMEFLSDCTGLTAIDLSPLAGVKSVDMGFLRRCTSLTAIDLSPLVKLKEVDLGFLSDCTGLRTVILPGTRAFRGVEFAPYITTISSDLMLMNDGRLELLHPRVNFIRSIINEQYENILGLRKVIGGNLAPLAQVKKLCPQFLDHVRYMKYLDLSPLEEVDEIGDGFLSWNIDLEKIEI